MLGQQVTTDEAANQLQISHGSASTDLVPKTTRNVALTAALGHLTSNI
jgi:hypothetical protein